MDRPRSRRVREPVAPIDGLLLLDKPAGPTSHDVVQSVRRCLGTTKVGHTGTLDPLATGLLPLVLGRATRLARYLPASPKVYTGALRLGLSTTTDDIAGEVVARHDGPWPAAGDVLAAAHAMVGPGSQAPPAYSARKVAGQRLYRLARQGRPVSAPPSPIEVWRLDLTPTSRADVYEFLAEVSGGTYVRALVRDLGRHLGCGAALERLSRRSIAAMSLDQAVPAADPLDPGRLLGAVVPPERMPLVPPALRLEPADRRARFLAGAPVAAPPGPEGLVTVFDAWGWLLGVGEVAGNRLRPRVVLPGRTPVV